MFLQPKVYSDMRRHAEECAPNESCGLVMWGGYVHRENVHSEPDKHFRIAEADLLPWLKTGRVQAVVHSHVVPVPPYPSYRDMQQQISMSVPWMIVPVTEAGEASDPFMWGDGTPIEPLLGRPYRWGVTDCYSIVRDWYLASCKIYLPEVARRWEYWIEPGATDLFLAKYDDAGFARVSPDEAGVGDAVLYRLPGRQVVSHAAVIISPGMVLHHPARRPYDPARLSLREPLARYQQYITHVLRPTDAVARA